MSQLPVTPDLAPVNAVLPPGCPQSWCDLTEQLYIELVLSHAACLTPTLCASLAELAYRQTRRICSVLGGLNYYLNKGVSFLLSPRNKKMCAEFRGDYKVVAKAYGLTEQQARNIIDEWQRQEYAKKQKPLFAGDGDAEGDATA